MRGLRVAAEQVQAVVAVELAEAQAQAFPPVPARR